MVYEDSEGATASMSVVDKLVTVTTKTPVYHRQSIPISADTDIDIGSISSLGFMMLKNLDPTNFVSIKTGQSGTVIGKMLAGETYGPVRVGSGIANPALTADTAACWVEILICAA